MASPPTVKKRSKLRGHPRRGSISAVVSSRKTRPPPKYTEGHSTGRCCVSKEMRPWGRSPPSKSGCLAGRVWLTGSRSKTSASLLVKRLQRGGAVVVSTR